MNAPAERIDVLSELRTMRKRFVNCATHNGSDAEFAEGACEPFDKAVAAVAALIEAAKKAQAMMAMPERIEPRHRQELCDAIARCEVVADPRLARVQGGQP